MLDLQHVLRPVQGLIHGGEDVQEAAASGVHHTGLLELGQQVRGLLQCPVRRRQHRREERLQIGLRVQLRHLLGAVRRGPHDGEDGALSGVHHRAVGALRPHREARGQVRRRGRGFPLQGPAHAPEKHREDHAGVAPGRPEHGLGRFGGAVPQRHLRGEGDLKDPLNGHGHIGAGVPVGHRKYVHIVDGLAVGLQQLGRVEQHGVIFLGR